MHYVRRQIECIGTAHRITADKREIKDFRKLPSATSFIHEPLADIKIERKE